MNVRPSQSVANLQNSVDCQQISDSAEKAYTERRANIISLIIALAGIAIGIIGIALTAAGVSLPAGLSLLFTGIAMVMTALFVKSLCGNEKPIYVCKTLPFYF